MDFYINGHIEDAKYCLIYKYRPGYKIEFLWRNGMVAPLEYYDEKYKSIVFWWNLEENWNVKNYKNISLNDRIWKMMYNNYMDNDWFITCFNECPNKLTQNELLSFIRLCCDKKRNHRTDDVRSGYKLKLVITNMAKDFLNTDAEEDYENYVLNVGEREDSIVLVNYENENLEKNKIGSKYVVMKAGHRYIKNDFSGFSDYFFDKNIYFKMNEIKISDDIKQKLTINKINRLKLFYFDEIPEVKNNKDLEYYYNKKTHEKPSIKRVHIESYEDFDYWINEVYKEKLKLKETRKLFRETKIIKSEDYHVSYEKTIEDGIDGEITRIHQFKNNKYELIEEKINKKAEDRIIFKGNKSPYFKTEEEVNLDTLLTLDLLTETYYNKYYNYNLKDIIRDVINTDLANLKFYQIKNYQDKEKTIETTSFFKINITVLNKEQTVNLFYNIVKNISEIDEYLFLYANNKGVFIEYNEEYHKNNKYYNVSDYGCYKYRLNNYYKHFIQPWKNSEEYQEIKETIEYKKDYKNYYSIEAPDKPKNKSKVVYFYHYVENKTNNNIIKIGRTNNQSNREVQYRRTGLENQGKTPAYLLNYSYTPLTGDDEVDKWTLYCNEDLLKYYCKLLCCETIEDFKEYLSSNKKTNEINNYVVELLSKDVRLDLLSKMEHRKSDFNGKVKLGEEYYQVLGDLSDIKEIINNFNLLMNNITVKDLLKLRSISELKAYIRKQIVSGELKLKEDEFVEKVENILNNETVEEVI